MMNLVLWTAAVFSRVATPKMSEPTTVEKAVRLLDRCPTYGLPCQMAGEPMPNSMVRVAA